MKLFPAIDLYDKKAVRLFKGNYDEMTVYSENPIEIADIIGVFIDNNDVFDINMWVSLDKDFFINVTDNNADQIIRYLFERYPY